MNNNTNPVLVEVPIPNTELKRWLVDYVGNQHGPSNGGVTVEMIVETVSQEFPEFLMAVAEENWIRGYHQAITDVQEGERLAREQQEKESVNEESAE